MVYININIQYQFLLNHFSIFLSKNIILKFLIILLFFESKNWKKKKLNNF
jgi:hypothetical protein